MPPKIQLGWPRSRIASFMALKPTILKFSKPTMWLLRGRGGGEVGGGYECFGLGKSFVPKPLVIEFFSSMSGISMQDFFLSESVWRIFFSEITHTPPQKSNGRPFSSIEASFVSLSSKKIPGILRVCCQKPIWVTYVSLSTKTISTHLISSAKRTFRTAANIIVI